MPDDDANITEAGIDDLGLPKPLFHLELGNGTHVEQTGRVVVAYEKVEMREELDLIVVV